MPRNGSGEYSLPAGYAATAGVLSDADTQHNAPLEDIAATLNAALPVVKGGTGATNASAARTALGLAIGTNVQAHDAKLDSISGLSTPGNRLLYTSALDTYALAPLTAAGRALLDDADAAAQRTTLGLGTAAVAALLDEDDMASDDETAVPSQQSVKAFVEAKSGRRFIDSQDASASATLDFTGFNAALYDAYEFVLSNVKPATDGVTLGVRTSTDGGSNYASGASDYKFASQLAIPGAVNYSGSTGAAVLNVAGAGPDAVGNAAGEDGVSGVVMVLGAHLATRVRIQGHTTFDRASDGSVAMFTFSGFRNAAADVDAIRFLFSSGNIESGTITMFGIRNS